MFRLTRSSEFPRCWVIVSLGCSEKNTVPPVTREVTEDPYVNWCPPHVCPAFVSFPVVIAVFHMLRITGSGPRFQKPEKLSEGKIVMFRLMRSSEFSRCWVIVSPGCSEKNTVPTVTREVPAKNR